MQHFLLSKAARTLSLAQVMRLSDDEAYSQFKAIRWAENDGEPVCPRCGCITVYAFKTRRIFKCKGYEAQFSVTTDTIFASRKLAIRDLLAAIAIFVNGAKGVSALQMSRDLDVQYKTAFVLTHKLREAMAADVKTRTVGGEVEIDGAYFGGYVKPENRKEDRKDRRLRENQTGKRRVVVVMRERKGRTVPGVFDSEGASLDMIETRVQPGSTVYADEGQSWDALSEKNEHDAARHLMMRQFEKTRRKDRPTGPTPDEIKAFLPPAEEPEAATSPATSPGRKSPAAS